jgi:predicted nucleotidyltransferase
MKVTVYNKTLNPQFWTENNILKPDIRIALLKIAKTLIQDIELKAHIRDIYFLGSSANYNWTTKSDVDLHILIDFNDLSMSEEMAKLYTKAITKKWNEEQEILIKGYNVEAYIQNVSEENRATGVYSITSNKWIKKATPENIVLDKNLIQQKYTTWVERINKDISSKNVDKLKKTMQDLVKMRESGLSAVGEFSTENLVFKILRQRGLIGKLKDTIQNIKNKSLSLKESVIKNLETKNGDELDDIEQTDVERIRKESGINILSGKELTLVYLIDNKVVGMLYTEFDTDGEFSFDIIVDKPYRKQGIGKLMIKNAIRRFNYDKDAYENPHIKLDVVNRNLESYLKSIGFKEVNRIQGHTIMTFNGSIQDGFDPTSFGSNCASTEGLPEPDYYKKEIDKMRKM